MKKLILLIIILTVGERVLAQQVYPSNRTISSLEKNILFNAHKKFTFTQQGVARLDSNELFNGIFYPSYTTLAPSDSTPTIITIENINAPSVQAGAWIGWSSRYWGPTKFKIEVYNTAASTPPNAPQNTWFTVANIDNYTAQDFIAAIPTSAPGKIRFTFYKASGTSGRLGISELFLLHNEGAQAYENLLVKYDRNMNVVLGNAVSTPDSTRGDLAIYANASPDNRASLKIGYNESNNLEIYRDRLLSDINFKTNQLNTGHMRFSTNNANMTFNGGKVGVGLLSPTYPFQVEGSMAVGSKVTGSIASLIILGPNSPTSSSNTRDISFEFSSAGKAQIRAYRGGSWDTFLQFLTTPYATNTPIERMHIDGNGNIGIGTTTPAFLLDVSGNQEATVGIRAKNMSTLANAFAQLRVEGDGGQGYLGYSGTGNTVTGLLEKDYVYLQADNNTAGLNIGAGTNGTIKFYTNGSAIANERMRIDKDGNVGIGTTTPLSKIHAITNATTITPLQTLETNGTGGRPYSLFKAEGANYGYVGFGKLNTDVMSVFNYRNAALEFGTNNTTRMAISNTGAVAIGISSNGSLSVKGNAGLFTLEGTDHGYIQFYPQTYASGRKAYIGFPSANATVLMLTNEFSTGTTIIRNGSTNTIYTNSSGQVGINTTAVPTGYKLAVAGDIIVEKVKVKKQANGWPDYVFSPEYKLPSLDEVEKFTKQNSHLPEIPSAKEIEKEGQDLGEMNRLLLKKVEELTLYMIELKKQSDKQSTLIETQNNKIDNQSKRLEEQEMEIKKLKAIKK